MTVQPRFTDLYFGMADSRNEAVQNPEAFFKSFVNHKAVIKQLRSRQKFLVLGPKGAGKSSVAWYLDLGKTATEFVRVADISHFPVTEVSDIKTGDQPGVRRGVTAWKLLLLCALLDLILEDQSSFLHQHKEVNTLGKELRDRGFMDPTSDRVVVSAAKTTVKIPVPHFGEIYSKEKSSSLHLNHIVPWLHEWVCGHRSANAHTLILDGLDSLYVNDPQYLDAMSALLQATYSLNQDLRASESSAHIVVLARNDMISRLHWPAIGNVRQDFGVELDWRVLSGKPQQEPLFQLVNKKAGSLIENCPADIVAAYLPSYADVGVHGSGAPISIEIHKYLLRLTRHTPRDLLRLFEYVRRVAESGDFPLTRQGQVTQEILREGVLQYSTKYFVDAVQTEFVGHGEEDSYLLQQGITALRHLEKSEFTLEEFSTECFGGTGRECTTQAGKILTWFFYAGAIGNVRKGRKETYLQFYHRREDVEIYLKGNLVLHNALIHAWNVPR